MPAPDYYQILGVSKTASQDEIRKAYKKLARKYHPDVKPNDKEAEQKFKEIQAAYDIVGDPEKRKQYDNPSPFNWGEAAGGRGGGPNPFAGGQVDLEDILRGFGGQGGPIDLGDIFGNAFGGGRAGGRRGGAGRRSTAQQGTDIRLMVEVPFATAVQGGTHDLVYTRAGRTEKLAVKIPAGIDDGREVRLRGQGEPGQNGGPPGDLLLLIRIAPHRYYRREGLNILVDLPLTVTEAALGAKVDVPTLTEGTVVLTIPPGTSSGAKLRIRGAGVPDRETGVRGDQFVVVKVAVPSQLSERAKKLFQELAEAAPYNPRSGLW